MESATPEKIGEANRKLILDYVRKFGPVSRADIHRHLEMSFPTVSTNVKRLLEAGYLLEAGDSDNSLGRKGTLLTFNAARAYVVGIDLGRSQIRVMLADLSGQEIAYVKENCDSTSSDQHAIVQQLCNMVDRAIQITNIVTSPIGCICLGVPGVPDLQSGRLLAAPFIHPLDLNEIIHTFQQRYNAPVIIDNSVNFGAIGEKWHGVAQGYRDIVYINYGVGIGAALILNNELYRGVNNAAGEIGFMVPDSSHMRKHFDVQGALETLISGKRIQENLKAMGLHTDIQQTGDYADILESITCYIGLALINITSVFNEEIIVIGGGLGDALGEFFIPEWTQMLQNHVPFVPKVVPSALRTRANVLGAVAVALRQVNDGSLDS